VQDKQSPRRGSELSAPFRRASGVPPTLETEPAAAGIVPAIPAADQRPWWRGLHPGSLYRNSWIRRLVVFTGQTAGLRRFHRS